MRNRTKIITHDHDLYLKLKEVFPIQSFFVGDPDEQTFHTVKITADDFEFTVFSEMDNENDEEKEGKE